ncbi:Cna protein B-type domain-containing protein [Bifidobacterium pseudolongum subsp. globosum]|uniref:Cna protein B-type domain-containing protein n=1 Tax=Bifidobacterium pseudolongum subsp. globosum TaxID=1690 RepID=A0A2N3R6Q7_9BIFI|nr:SpaA isopeptide-forming pilin-related protein [Bifidobacterium pseudolongum]PKU90211.1 Cna protein B-type domain-containing protein [Bifidobacterium pseudolongum subsp. globosum]PKV05044.1 Cna protein B-type domain-containing protein [Bifidobacterium pseudolongum subsp. globosum]
MAIVHRNDDKAGISETRVCAWKHAVVALAVAVSLIFLPVVGTTAVAQDDAPAVSQSDAASDTASMYLPLTTDKIDSGKSVVTLRVDGQEVTQFNPPPVLPAHANLKFDLDITITDKAIHNGHPDDPLKYQLDWEYQLPIDYKSINDTKGNNGQPKDHVVYENGVRVATLRVVPGDGGNAKLQISYDRDYVVSNGKNTNFYFRYGLDVNWIPNVDEETLRQTWVFPGTGSSITVQREPWGVTGQKSCTQPDIDTLKSTCTVTLNAEGDIEGFTFVDKWEEGLTVEQNGFTMQKKSASGDLVDIDEWNPAFKWNVEGQVSLKTDNLPIKENGTRFLPKGEYVITYTAQINDKATPNGSGNQYVNARNTAKWQWNGHKEETSTVTPNVPQAHYNWVGSKWGNWGDNDEHTTINWTVQINTGNDKFNLDNYKFVDTLQRGHHYTGDGVRVKCFDDWGNQGALQLKLWSDLRVDNTETGMSFTYEFPENAGKKICVIEYSTKVDANPEVSEWKNTGEIQCNKNNGCDPAPEPGIEASVKTDQPVNPGFNETLLTKSSPAQQDGYVFKEAAPGSGVYKVPWQIDFTPPKGGQPITDLFLYEDWVHGTSDGNTLHMWYSRDYLDLKLEEETEPGKWMPITDEYTVVEADRNNPSDGCKNETDPNRADTCYAGLTPQNDKPAARPLPMGTEYPKGWYRESDRNSADSYGNHDGAPAFRIVFKNSERAFNKPLRITYNTLCDGAPDRYHNYAKFRYMVNGNPRYEVPQTDIMFSQGHAAGKMVHANRDGEASWHDKAESGMVPADPSDPNNKVDGWTAHWRVWSNGVKSWWICDWLTDANGNQVWNENGPYKVEVPGMSGIQDLSQVDKIIVTDTLPSDKWHLNTSKPVFGWFVSMPPKENVTVDGTTVEAWPTTKNEYTENFEAGEQWHAFKIARGGTCKDKNGKDGTCATYSESGGQIVFTIPNDGKLANWKYEGDPKNENMDLPEINAEELTIPVQGNSIIVLEFDTYITKTDANLPENSAEQVTNRIEFDFGKLGSQSASGTTTLAKGDVVKPSKRGYDAGNNLMKYTVEVDTKTMAEKRLRPFTASESLTLEDQLGSPNAEYVRDSFSLTMNNSQTVDKEYWTLQFGRNDNGNATVTVALRGDAQGDNPYWADDPNHLTLNDATLQLHYNVQVTGVPGVQRPISNTVRLKGSTESAFTHTGYVQIVKPNADAGATGATVLTKRDSTNVTAVLQGAEFSVCKVPTGDTNVRPLDKPCETPIATYPTDSNGKIAFKPGEAGLSFNTLYVAWESKAPAGYRLDATPHYFYIASASNTDEDKSALKSLQDYVAKYELAATYSGFDVYDKPIQVSWGKVDAAKVMAQENGSVAVQGSAFLPGSEWEITRQCPTEAVPPSGEEQCAKQTWTVRDDGTTEGNAQKADRDPASGYITVVGLPAGTYALTETKAPQDYHKGNGSYTFTINPDGTVQWANADGSDFHETSSGLHVVGNHKATVTLPSAGGRGMHLIALGLAVVAAGMCLAVVASGRGAKGRHAA